jgi:hypothetical protein
LEFEEIEGSVAVLIVNFKAITDEWRDFFAAEFTVLIGIGAAEHLSGELSRGGRNSCPHAIASNVAEFFLIEQAVRVAIKAFEQGFQRFGQFFAGQFAVTVLIHAFQAFDDCSGITWRPGRARHSGVALAREAAAKFLGVEAAVAITIELFEGGDSEVDFLFREFAVAILIEGIEERIGKPSHEATGGTAAWGHKHSWASAFARGAFGAASFAGATTLVRSAAFFAAIAFLSHAFDLWWLSEGCGGDGKRNCGSAGNKKGLHGRFFCGRGREQGKEQCVYWAKRVAT